MVHAKLGLVRRPGLGRIIDVLRQHGMVVVAAPVPDPYRDGGGETTGHRTREITDPGSRGQLVRSDPRHQDLIQRQEEKCHAKALQKSWRGKLKKTGAFIQRRGPKDRESKNTKRKAGGQAQIEPRHIAADDGRDEQA